MTPSTPAKMELTTRTAQRLKELKVYIESDKYSDNSNNEFNAEIQGIIDFKNELKEMIKLPMVKEHIELLIEEIEQVENESKNKVPKKVL